MGSNKAVVNNTISVVVVAIKARVVQVAQTSLAQYLWVTLVKLINEELLSFYNQWV